MKRHLTSSSSLLSIAVLVVLLLSGCGTQSEELKAILNSSAASIQLTTGREVSRTQQDRGTGLLGKPIPVEVSVEYEPVNNHTKEEVFAEIIATLEQEKWEPKQFTPPPPSLLRSQLAAKTLFLTHRWSIYRIEP